MRESRFRFDNFVVGASNRLAVSAALAVARAPGSAYNPLFIYGPSGLGKTHLLTALHQEARAINRKLAAAYLTLQDFTGELSAAVAAGQAETFRRRYQRLELLLLDDLQFLDGRSEAQAELLRILVALQEPGGQLVLASDRPPSEFTDIDRRLLSRMTGGLVVDIGVPEYETRVAILRNVCAERRLAFAPGILEEVARASTDSVRELHGMLNKLVAQQTALRAPLTLAKARDLLGRSTPVREADEFEAFVSEIATVVSKSVESWRVRLSETIARWSGEGFRTDVLERVLEAAGIPDLDRIEAQFVATVNRLRALEVEAARLDPKLAGMPVFRDPARLAEAEAIVQRALMTYDPAPAPLAHFTIDGFVVGARNQLAVRAAGEVIGLPGACYNPLYVFGPPGSGKSHLAHAIGNALAARDGGTWTVACVGANELADEILQALRDGSIDRWRLRYRSVDALVVDDVHLLAEKAQAQEELFHLFNALQDAGRQIVLAAPGPPSALEGVAPRLRTRFEGGLVVEIGEVTEAERVARHTPVPDGAEAAAPTIDAWYDEAEAPRSPRTPAPVTGGGIDTFFLDPEKVIIEWPSVDGRVVEEMR